MSKKLFSGYVSEEVFQLVNYLSKREEISKVVFTRRAIRNFVESEKKIDPRILITQRSDPEYIERKALLTVYVRKSNVNNWRKWQKKKAARYRRYFFRSCLITVRCWLAWTVRVSISKKESRSFVTCNIIEWINIVSGRFSFRGFLHYNESAILFYDNVWMTKKNYKNENKNCSTKFDKRF